MLAWAWGKNESVSRERWFFWFGCGRFQDVGDFLKCKKFEVHLGSSYRVYEALSMGVLHPPNKLAYGAAKPF